MKVLITGAGGQLGRDLHLHRQARGDEVVAATRTQLDVGDRDAVYQAITGVQPRRGAARRGVDGGRRVRGRPRLAWRVNALGTRWVADASRRVGAQLVTVSTDYVFDGTRAGPTSSGTGPTRSRPTAGRSGAASTRSRCTQLRGRVVRRGCAASTAATW